MGKVDLPWVCEKVGGVRLQWKAFSSGLSCINDRLTCPNYPGNYKYQDSYIHILQTHLELLHVHRSLDNSHILVNVSIQFPYIDVRSYLSVFATYLGRFSIGCRHFVDSKLDVDRDTTDQEPAKSGWPLSMMKVSMCSPQHPTITRAYSPAAGSGTRSGLWMASICYPLTINSAHRPCPRPSKKYHNLMNFSPAVFTGVGDRMYVVLRSITSLLLGSLYAHPDS